ncbi:hypothetical protein SOCEGT47_053450 [Sorangium cellulosum]|jgi:hypothetical protein|uniref:Uncharacterized protein n=1 Tax=Sorangium cellulosum TaxID=56 RepID=A0A4P2Q5W0_SORCE|nr:hypothetical protein [Sorangium cellulosum]AUX24805.1 hypothetical protein SOCEGT47_053450 [Sorangium cellulosum]
MKYDIGMICSACGCVTIFQVEDNTPRRCARCHDVDVDTPLAPPCERPAPPGLRGRRQAAPQLDWME